MQMEDWEVVLRAAELEKPGAGGDGARRGKQGSITFCVQARWWSLVEWVQDVECVGSKSQQLGMASGTQTQLGAKEISRLAAGFRMGSPSR
jgi:hypothetical protein